MANRTGVAIEHGTLGNNIRRPDILGKNDDSQWVFEMPAACNDDGTAKSVAVISAGDRTVPAGDGRFA